MELEEECGELGALGEVSEDEEVGERGALGELGEQGAEGYWWWSSVRARVGRIFLLKGSRRELPGVSVDNLGGHRKEEGGGK